MAKFNGKGPEYCKNCGGDNGIHHCHTAECPAGGVDQTGKDFPHYLTTIFEPQDWEEKIKNGGFVSPKTIFDEYFIAIISGSSAMMTERMIEDHYKPNISDLIVESAFLLASKAVAKRNEYLEEIK